MSITMKKHTMLMAASLLASTQANSYPFDLPQEVSASININTTNKERYNNLQLGTNIFKFMSQTEKDLVRRYDPITVRFPHGLWANWYDWETDGTRLYGEEQVTYINASGGTSTKTVDHLNEIYTLDNLGIKVGIEGLTTLNQEKLSSQAKGYDMLWTFNMSADGTNFNNGSPVSVARYDDLIARGFEVKAIEMGNENFYPNQRSTIIPNANEYILRAKSMSAALKARDPELRVSVPLLRRNSTANPTWNQDLTANRSYFDAVTIHTYVGADPDDPERGDDAFSTALTARYHMAASIDDYAGQVAPDKPIWLSEWGVKSGDANAVSVLGMADVYVFMSQNQDRYERANWFSINGKLNSFLIWEDYVAPSGVTRSRIKYPLEKTAYGAAYEVIRDTFENSVLLGSWMASPDLMPGVESVSARAVVKNGKTTVFVINLTDKSVPFDVNLDGQGYTGAFNHRAMAFSWMGEKKDWPIDDDPMVLVKSGSGAITLPKFSISTIELQDANISSAFYKVGLVAPTENFSYKVGDAVDLRAVADSSSNDVDYVNFRVNGSFLIRDNAAPYEHIWIPTSPGTYTIDAVAVKADGTRRTTNTRTITVAEGSVYVHMAKANASGFAIDGGQGAADNQNVKLWSASTDNVNQQWQQISRSGDYYSYKKRGTQFCLDAGYGGANNQNIRLKSCDYSNQNQHFKKVSHGGNKYQLVKRNSTGYAIDLGTGGSNGQNVKLWDKRSGADSNQVLIFTAVE